MCPHVQLLACLAAVAPAMNAVARVTPSMYRVVLQQTTCHRHHCVVTDAVQEGKLDVYNKIHTVLRLVCRAQNDTIAAAQRHSGSACASRVAGDAPPTRQRVVLKSESDSNSEDKLEDVLPSPVGNGKGAHVSLTGSQSGSLHGDQLVTCTTLHMPREQIQNK